MISVATICSHSALQIFHGARAEGLRTIGIAKKGAQRVYDAFPLAAPDEYILVTEYWRVIESGVQKVLLQKGSIIIPHGSFVEYVGAENIFSSLKVPVFGNRKSLRWESSRAKQKEWMKRAGIRSPGILRPDEIDGKAFVKFDGAKGGSGFFTAGSKEEFLGECRRRGVDPKTATIQEFIAGARYYLHYFYSPLHGRLEFFGADRRVEIIDEAYRGLPDVPKEFFDYTVTGNAPVVLRESLLPEVFEMGEKVVKASEGLFSPGLIGPFCLETIYTKKGFVCFEISARIVAGTNLYPDGSPYARYVFSEPMSTGRRIAREIGEAHSRGELGKVTS